MVQVLLNVVSVLNIFFIILVVFFERKKPESTLAWVLILFFVPYVGIFLYIVFGDFFRFGVRKKERDKILNDENYLEQVSKQINILKKDENLRKNYKWTDLIIMNSVDAKSLMSFDNNIETFSKASDKYDRLYEDIKNAKESVHVSYYIIRKDYYGKILLDLLVKKAKEGVEVRLIFDHIGSKITSKKFFKPLIKAGGKVEKFFPSRIFFKLYINHRNHRKMVIIDGKIGYLGGMNIGKEYASEDKKITPWCDKHIRIEGSAVISMQIQFFLDYLFVSNEKIAWEDVDEFNKYYKLDNKKGDKAMQIVSSGPDYKESNIRNNYLKMISNARNNITIETPYLILDESILVALKLAASSGVKVRIVIPGVPDKKVVYYATMSYARELMEYGVEIYKYNGFMHSKIVIVDDDIVCVGSANMDRRSFNLNFEMNAVIYDESYNEECKRLVDREIENSVLYNDDKKNNLLSKFFEKIMRLFAPII